MSPQPAELQNASQRFGRIAQGIQACVLIFLVAVLAGETALAGARADASTRAEASKGSDVAREIMVVSGNPLASEVGLAVLRRGGNAVDAAVAVQMMMSFVAGPSTG